ncbi:hypothetical protein MFU01_83640 [Myxococcus fulvus]|uniref:Uncharacterized protein n=1 Tax=Myxococcus fulvus TaxID=33 RepID=A0A511TGM9_MYXFU|nr:hypothetical protein MFU01_83640 [Myxococcus fulvus]
MDMAHPGSRLPSRGHKDPGLRRVDLRAGAFFPHRGLCSDLTRGMEVPADTSRPPGTSVLEQPGD